MPLLVRFFPNSRRILAHLTDPTDPFTELDTLSEESYKDSTLIMQLLRDNLVRLPELPRRDFSLTSLDSLDFFRGRDCPRRGCPQGGARRCRGAQGRRRYQGCRVSLPMSGTNWLFRTQVLGRTGVYGVTEDVVFIQELRHCLGKHAETKNGVIDFLSLICFPTEAKKATKPLQR